ncbi:MAG TPA: hypothetical protein DE315_08660 [Candidatus Omnitrophica bacterium]|nr:MAG: hypothetical protein A2Y05_04920 [Omnitrophica WOR_2 bacterium GWA2_53_43]HBO98028.1 hypothetical protein [Candidatus Omnitrophota bacterium]HCI45580.1 hypothetical protein [Candidatus Omnitrophota bacterium]
MKRYPVLILTAVLLFFVSTESRAGINQEINRQTPFNNFTDSLATIGKSPKQKTAIKNKRRLARSKARLKKIREAHSKRSASR